MKKLMTMMLGLSLVLGAASLAFGQETAPAPEKKAKKAKKTKKEKKTEEKK